MIRATSKAMMMARHGRLCSNCRWKSHYSSKSCGYPSCTSPIHMVTTVDPIKGIVREFAGAPPRCKDVYGRRGCRWEAVEQ